MKEKRFFCSLCAGRRKIFFCFLLFSLLKFCEGESFFNFAEYKFTSAFTLPCGESEKEKAVSGSTGLRLSFRDFDLRGYVTLPKTGFNEIYSAETLSEKKDLLNDFRYGAGIFLFKNSFPLTIKAGQNTYSNVVSKLKNPSPSTTGNPLTKSFAFSTGNGASLPTLTSSVQPLSISAGFSIPEEIFFLPLQADFFITEDKNSVVNLASKFSITKFMYVIQSVSAGRFFIENNSTVLKKNNANFDGDWFFSLLSQTAFHSPLLKLHLYAGFQQSPYDSDSLWLKLDGRTTFNFFLLDFSYFFIPTAKDSPKVAPLIGGSSSICRIVEQGSINPQMIFLFYDKNASSLRLGFSALENWKETSTNVPVLLNVLKLRAGSAYENKFFSLRLDWTYANILLSGEPPTKSSRPEKYQCYVLSSSFFGKNCKSSVSASYYHYPPFDESSVLKQSCSAKLALSFPKLKLNFQSGGEVVFKDGEAYSASVDMSLSYSMKKKFVRTSAKIEFEMPVL